MPPAAFSVVSNVRAKVYRDLSQFATSITGSGKTDHKWGKSRYEHDFGGILLKLQ